MSHTANSPISAGNRATTCGPEPDVEEREINHNTAARTETASIGGGATPYDAATSAVPHHLVRKVELGGATGSRSRRNLKGDATLAFGANAATSQSHGGTKGEQQRDRQHTPPTRASCVGGRRSTRQSSKRNCGRTWRCTPKLLPPMGGLRRRMGIGFTVIIAFRPNTAKLPNTRAMVTDLDPFGPRSWRGQKAGSNRITHTAAVH